MKFFQIDTYEVFENDIEIEILQNDKLELITASRLQFEKWLEDSDRLDYCFDSCDAFGEHQQETGTLPVERYFDDYKDEKIKNDLYDFIVVKMLWKEVFQIDFKNAVK